MDKKTEKFMVELNWRTNLWERKRDSAKRRMEAGEPLAKIDLGVAEDALKRIAKKREEILRVDEEPKVDYTDPVEMEALKGRVRKKAKALSECSPVVDIVERQRSETDKERLHSHPKGTFGGEGDQADD